MINLHSDFKGSQHNSELGVSVLSNASVYNTLIGSIVHSSLVATSTMSLLSIIQQSRTRCAKHIGTFNLSLCYAVGRKNGDAFILRQFSHLVGYQMVNRNVMGVIRRATASL